MAVAIRIAEVNRSTSKEFWFKVIEYMLASRHTSFQCEAEDLLQKFPRNDSLHHVLHNVLPYVLADAAVQATVIKQQLPSGNQHTNIVKAANARHKKCVFEQHWQSGALTLLHIGFPICSAHRDAALNCHWTHSLQVLSNDPLRQDMYTHPVKPSNFLINDAKCCSRNCPLFKEDEASHAPLQWRDKNGFDASDGGLNKGDVVRFLLRSGKSSQNEVGELYYLSGTVVAEYHKQKTKAFVSRHQYVNLRVNSWDLRVT